MTGHEPFSRSVRVEEPDTACDLLARTCGLSKGRVKDCMTKGGVWWGRPGRAMIRLRRATAAVRPGDGLEINFDPTLLALTPPEPACLFRNRRYSVWNKPAGVLAQGTRFADHCALPRLAQRHLGLKAEPHPVHRLDREAMGLMLLAHDGRTAAALSELFRRGKVEKEYSAIVAGIPDWTEQTVELPLDGRASRSCFRVVQTDAPSRTALLRARIDTGRKHQIRRHLAAIGFPVLGDPRHGRNNSCPLGLLLAAVRLAFVCPFDATLREWSLPALPFPCGRETPVP